MKSEGYGEIPRNAGEGKKGKKEKRANNFKTRG